MVFDFLIYISSGMTIDLYRFVKILNNNINEAIQVM